MQIDLADFNRHKQKILDYAISVLVQENYFTVSGLRLKLQVRVSIDCNLL